MNEILRPVEAELEEFERYFGGALYSDVQLIKDIAIHIGRGKRLRPALMFLVARYFGVINEKVYNSALVIELIHTATLLHDDVIDESTERRNKSSINNKWNNKTAILMGDFIFAQMSGIALKNNDFKIFEAINETTRIMTEGELLAIQLRSNLDYAEDTYYKLIYAKTASLIEISCKISASNYTADKDLIRRVSEFGKNVGMAFQIKDDIFDYSGDSKTIGKPIGNDIREKKLTLPLIFALSNSNPSDACVIRDLIKKDELNDVEVDKIIGFTINNRGVEDSYQKASEFVELAINNIDFIEDNELKGYLVQFAFYVINRTR